MPFVVELVVPPLHIWGFPTTHHSATKLVCMVYFHIIKWVCYFSQGCAAAVYANAILSLSIIYSWPKVILTWICLFRHFENSNCTIKVKPFTDVPSLENKWLNDEACFHKIISIFLIDVNTVLFGIHHDTKSHPVNCGHIENTCTKCAHWSTRDLHLSWYMSLLWVM